MNTIENYLNDPSSVDPLYKAALDAIAPNKMRDERNALLLKSDWTQILDNGLSDEKRNEWIEYRQVLRDMPTNNPDITIDINENVINLVFPIEPE
jgi:hypothetical protein